MAEIKVKFHHPTSGQIITVDIDDSMTGQEAVAELLANDFIKPDPQGYELNVKGGAQIPPNSTFSNVGDLNGADIRVTRMTDAGC